MIGFKVDVKDETKRVVKAVARATEFAFRRAAFAIRKTAIESIESAPRGVPSDPGMPPHTHQRAYLRRAIIYHADRSGAVIGPRYSAVGDVGRAHEFGGEYRGGTFPPRPFMGPALDANLDKIASSWSGSITE